MKTILMLMILLVNAVFVIVSCVPQSEYDELNNKYDELLKEDELLRDEISTLKDRKAFLNEICNVKNVQSELKNYLEFYCPDCLFKDFNIRKVDDCRFDVRMKKKSKDNQPYASWIYVTVRMTFTEDGMYYIEDVDGSHKWACLGR